MGLCLKAQQPMSAALQDALQTRLVQILSNEELQGVSCYIESGEKGYWYGAAGIENIAQSQPMDTTYSFWAASVTKIFTSALIFKLYEDSLLDIQDKIVDCVPGHANINANATIEQALNHTSGIADILRHPNATQQWFNQNASKQWEPNEVLSNYLQAPDFNPGAAWGYSNTNYILLGMIIETVTGKSYAAHLEDEIINPLGLTDTWFPPFMESTNEVAKGYSDFNQDGELEDANFLHSTSFATMVFTAGALISSPKDLAKIATELYSGNLFKSSETLGNYLQFLNVRISQHALGYGYGCNSFDYLGDVFYGHGGDINGYTNYAIYSPDADISLSLMINRDQADREYVTEELLKVFKNTSVGLEEAKAHSNSFHPNPANDVLYLQGIDDNTEVSIINTVGKTILKTNSSQIDVSQMPAGMYILQLANPIKTSSYSLAIE